MQKSRNKSHDASGGPLPRGTVTFLFTDIEGSTRLLAQLREAMPTSSMTTTAPARRDREHGGERSTPRATPSSPRSRALPTPIAAALAAQRALAAQPLARGRRTCACAWACTRAKRRSATGTTSGSDVHRAARICSAAHGGQVLVSSATRELVAGEVAAGVSLTDLGEHRLKDLERPERLFQLVAADLLDDFPPPRSRRQPGAADRAAARAQPHHRPGGRRAGRRG